MVTSEEEEGEEAYLEVLQEEEHEVEGEEGEMREDQGSEEGEGGAQEEEGVQVEQREQRKVVEAEERMQEQSEFLLVPLWHSPLRHHH